MVSVFPARQLFAECRFEEAVDAYKHQLRGALEPDWPNLGGLAEALMASGRYSEAIPIFEKVGKYECDCNPGTLGRREQLSVCHWMIGDHDGALERIRNLVIGVRDGKINYTDISGGVSYGIILCYMAITLGVTVDVDLGMKYLKKLTTRVWIKNWPGPVAQFLLGARSFGDAMKEAVGSADLTEAIKLAGQDPWGPRRLTPLLFAAGTERRMAGDETGCRTFFAECASLTNPLVEYEWYLAKSEIPNTSQT
jgi:tetratricopeptide (TPR) repeat protein